MFLSIFISSLFFIKKELIVYLFQLLELLNKIYRFIFQIKRNRTKNIRKIRKELYKPLRTSQQNHISLNISDAVSLKRRKPTKLTPVFLKNNEKLNEISISNEKTLSEEKKIIPEKTLGFSSLPQELTNERTFGHEKQMKFEQNQIKGSKQRSFLPSTLLKLADFQQLNEEFANKCGEKITNKEFAMKIIEKEASFLDIHKKLCQRSCFQKKCACFHKKYPPGMKKNPFQPTMLTPIIENLYYI